VQPDARFVPLVGRAHQRFFQFTTMDKATRFRVLRICDREYTRTSIDFLQKVRKHFPSDFERFRTDNASSFIPQFTWHLSDPRISNKHISPHCPKVNGAVERSHKTASQELCQERLLKHKRALPQRPKNEKPNPTSIDHIPHSKDKYPRNKFAHSFSHLSLPVIALLDIGIVCYTLQYLLYVIS